MVSSSRRTLITQTTKGVIGAGLAMLLVACGQSAQPAATSAPAAPPPSAPTAQPTAVPTAVPTMAPTVAPTMAPTTAPAATPAPQASGAVTLNFYSGGDVNVHDLWANSLLPAYKKVAPNVAFNFVFSEHGNGDQTTYDRIAAAKQADKLSGVDIWETGLLLQGGDAGLMVKFDTQMIPNIEKVPTDVIKQMGGYGVPYRGSSVVLAYDSKTIPNPPTTLDAIITWIKSHDGLFTYNPPDTGGSGGAWVTRVLEMGIPDADLQLFQTGYDASKESEWDKGFGVLKDIHPHTYNHGAYPKGNVPVLQALGKGSITMAPVWSDMGLSYLAQNLLPPEIKLTQIDPPFSGGASYVGVPADAQNKTDVFAFLNWLLTPEPQTVVINVMNGYPGLDWKYMPDAVRQKYAQIAKTYSYGFSSKFGSDMNKQWYEKVAGTPPPTPKSS